MTEGSHFLGNYFQGPEVRIYQLALVNTVRAGTHRNCTFTQFSSAVPRFEALLYRGRPIQ